MRSIGDVAKEAGLRPSAIRYYESVGLLPSPARANGRRRYDDSIFGRLALIELAQQAGFTIGEIKTLLHGFSRKTPASARWRALTGRKLEEVEERIRQARRRKRVLLRLAECECPTFEDCALPHKGRG